MINGIEDLKAYGMVEDEGRRRLGDSIADSLEVEGRVRIWKMPSTLVGRDESGRLILVGNPRSDYELAERIARALGRKIVWAAVVEVPRAIWSVVKPSHTSDRLTSADHNPLLEA